MSEKLPTLTEIGRLIEAAAETIIAALKSPAPAPTPDPMPDGGAGPIRVFVGIRGPAGAKITLGESRQLYGGCEGFDPGETGAVWLDPDNEPIPVDRVEVLDQYVASRIPPNYRRYNVLVTWTPKKEYPKGSTLVFVTGVPEPAALPLAVEVVAGAVQPQRNVEPARPIDPPAPGGWARPTEAQYLAGDRLPVCRSAADVGLAKERIKLGRLPWINSLAEGPTAVVTFAELMAGYDRIEKLLALSKEDYYAGWWHVHEIELDLVCAIAILGKQAGLPAWDDPYAGGSAGTTTPYGRADKLAGFTLGQWLAGAFQSGTGGSLSGA